MLNIIGQPSLLQATKNTKHQLIQARIYKEGLTERAIILRKLKEPLYLTNQ